MFESFGSYVPTEVSLGLALEELEMHVVYSNLITHSWFVISPLRSFPVRATTDNFLPLLCRSKGTCLQVTMNSKKWLVDRMCSYRAYN